MAKKRLRIKDSSGNPVDYDVAAGSVTMLDGTDVQTKIGQMDSEIDQLGTGNYNLPEGGIPKSDLAEGVRDSLDKADSSIQCVSVNNSELTPDENGKVNVGIPAQVQPDWNSLALNSPAYIRNKPSKVVTDVFYEDSSAKIWKSVHGFGNTLVADLSDLFKGVAYDSTNNVINFTNKRGTIIAVLDARPFTSDKFVQSVALNGSNLVITFNTTGGGDTITVPLSSIGGQGTVQSVKMNGGSPIQPVDGVIDLGTVLTQHQDISGKADKSEMSVVQGTGANADKTTITLKNGTSAQVINQHQSLANYPTKSEMNTAIQQASQGETVVTSVDNVALVDGFNSSTVLAGATARSVKELYDNVMALRNALAGIAFKDGMPSWQTVAKAKYTLTTSLTGCEISVTSTYGVVESGVQKIYEGDCEVTISPNTSGLTFNTISVTKNGSPVTIKQTTDNQDGSKTIKFLADGDVTLTAIAVSGYAITIDTNNSSNVSITSQSHSGNTYTVNLKAAVHHTMPTSVSVYNGNTEVATGITYTRTNNNTQATLVINNVSSDLSIRATAVVMSSMTVTFPQDHSYMVIKHGTETLTGDSKTVYEDDLNYTITFEPADGYSWSTAPNVSGEDLPNSGNSYTLTVDNVNSNIAVSAETRLIQMRSVTLPSNMTMNAGDDETELSGEQTVTDGDSFECYFKVNKEVPSNNNKYNNDEPNNVVVMMGSENITATAYNYKTGKITINEVRGNVVITATPITFTERRFIGSSGSESDQYSDKTYSYCDYLEVPDGVKTVVVSYGVATGSSDSRYTAFYDDNKANPTATRVKTMYKSITVPSGAKFIRSSFKVSETGGVRDYSLRRTRYILGIKNDDSTVYIYKGDGYDGRYEDMGLEFDKKSNASNSISSSDGFAITKLIEIPQDCVSIKAMLGAYSGDASASQTICFFDSNKSFISGAGAAANTEATIAVPTGAIYLRASMHGIDNCYIKDDTNDDYIFKGLSVQ